jgi:hypothetical protein
LSSLEGVLVPVARHCLSVGEFHFVFFISRSAKHLTALALADLFVQPVDYLVVDC